MIDAALLALLRRRPDVEAPNLVAVDAADRLLLQSADAALAAADPADVVVIGDSFGALTLGALAALAAGRALPSASAGRSAPASAGREASSSAGRVARAAGVSRPSAPREAPVRTHQDPLLAERALTANAAALAASDPSLAELPGGYRSLPLTPELVTGARFVLLRLPKSLDALDEQAQLIAAHARPEVTVLAAGMVKHMTLAQNEVLARHFGAVSASLAQQKARVLTARLPFRVDPAQHADAESVTRGPGPKNSSAPQKTTRPAAPWPTWPRTVTLPEPGLTISAHGGVFAGTRLDIGTRFLLPLLPQAAPAARTAIDLGCGSGVLAAALATARPQLAVLATDQSAAAVASARETMALNGVTDRVTVMRDDALGAQPDASAELIVLNPPFHSGTTVTAEVGLRLIADAARVLAPGGELWVVFNSHLRYQAALRRLVGSTREVARNPKFTVTASTRGGGAG